MLVQVEIDRGQQILMSVHTRKKMGRSAAKQMQAIWQRILDARV